MILANVQVNPTRMELKRYKNKLLTARRGHKLLKDKCDELMRQFLDSAREAKDLRAALTKKLGNVTGEFRLAAAMSDSKIIYESLLSPLGQNELEVKDVNVMSVIVPSFRQMKKADADSCGGAGYGYAFTSASMDRAVSLISETGDDMVRLAELEKRSALLCDEIERTRRRVNALEYIMIPEYSEIIRHISMKLDENERSNLTRLMKVKDMMLEKKVTYDED